MFLNILIVGKDRTSALGQLSDTGIIIQICYDKNNEDIGDHQNFNYIKLNICSCVLFQLVHVNF